MSQPRGRPQGERRGTGVALASTILLHATVFGALAWSPELTREVQLPVYEVELVAAPRPRPEERRAPEAVQRPAESAIQTTPREPRRTTVSPETPPPVQRPQETEKPVRTTPEEPPVPEEEPSTGSDPGTVSVEGVEFPYPQYLTNIVAQVYRRWNRPSGNTPLRAEIIFFIRRDGSVSNLRFVERSGSFAFDLEAQGAIEAAANAGAFGPLPEGYPADILPVSFFFDPETTR